MRSKIFAHYALLKALPRRKFHFSGVNFSIMKSVLLVKLVNHYTTVTMATPTTCTKLIAKSKEGKKEENMSRETSMREEKRNREKNGRNRRTKKQGTKQHIKETTQQKLRRHKNNAMFCCLAFDRCRHCRRSSSKNVIHKKGMYNK